MSLFKCKMCGGELEIGENQTIATCEYCGTQQTLPRICDDKKANLYDRANHFRRNNEFDKAMGIYEQILNEDNTDAESYWSLVLCRYGIEYVEDPATHRRVPTVNRAQFTSVFDDDNYKSAIKYADIYQKAIYEKEATEINEIQKGILTISQNEEPFDVFICYKETDKSGARTRDSALANELYHQLTQDGFKVFFSRITLEDKLGTAYEPYIFAALNSAKVMVVIGTKPEYFNAVWVRNEWSRYLALVKESQGKKMLIPAYKDMDPYDLPEEFSHLQAQDMSKLGFMQDLTRGIKKILSVEKPKTVVKETVIVNSANADIAPLLKRVFMFLEDREWNKADEFCEQVLNKDPENAQAYLGKLMAELGVRKKEDLKNCNEPFDNSINYQKIMRFGDGTLKKELQEIEERKENARLTALYNDAVDAMQSATTEQKLLEAKTKFEAIKGFKDADALAERCGEKAKNCVYEQAKSRMALSETEADFMLAKEVFEIIKGFKDADALAEKCGEEAKNCVYIKAKSRMELSKTESDFLEAKAVFEKIKGFKDADALVEKCGEEAKNCVYERAKNMMALSKTESDLLKAKAVFETIKGFKDADVLAEKCGEEAKNRAYEQIKGMMASSKTEADFLTTKKEFEIIKGFKDADVLAEKCGEEAKNCVYEQAKSMMASSKTEADFLKVKAEFERIKGFKDADAFAKACEGKAIKANRKKAIAPAVYVTIAVALAFAFVWVNAIQPMLDYNNAVALMEQGEYGEAISAFKALNDYKDSGDKIAECNYNIAECNYNTAVELMEQEEYIKAIAIFDSIDKYKKDEAAAKSAEIRKILAPKETVSAGWDYTIGLKSNGTVVARGDNDEGQCNVSSWKDIITVSAGAVHTVGLKSDGTVVAVGNNTNGQYNVSGWEDIIAVSAGYAHTVGLKPDGTVVAVGWKKDGQCDVSNWKDIIAVSAGADYTVGLKSDGTVVAVGWNYYGQCDVTSWKNVIAVCAGNYHTVGLKSDGTVVAVGSNGYGQCDVSNWKDIIAVSAGGRHTVGLKSDGTVVAVGDNENGQCNVSRWKDIIAVSAGCRHTVGLKSDGTVVAVGSNGYRQCNVSSWENIATTTK